MTTPFNHTCVVYVNKVTLGRHDLINHNHVWNHH